MRGLEAVESDLEDDGHWGGFQLRIPEYIKRNGLTEGTIAACFGFELCPHEAIQECRVHLYCRTRIRMTVLSGGLQKTR
ncbi:MAG: hypothetical protein JWR21_2006 [Herminiimonas sp.]|nr:hypothetical protein [Herminiimonas sp.]MDB5852970.1 hypothetical protein [Herminiimonas sp.]